MSNTIDLSDVPAVSAGDLGVAIRILVERGRGLAFITGLPEDEIRAVEAQIWSRFEDDPGRRLAVVLRFRSLIAVFSARRLKALMLDRGYGLIREAVTVAAAARLNMTWGFNPQRFVGELMANTNVRQGSRQTTEVGLRMAA